MARVADEFLSDGTLVKRISDWLLSSSYGWGISSYAENSVNVNTPLSGFVDGGPVMGVRHDGIAIPKVDYGGYTGVYGIGVNGTSVRLQIEDALTGWGTKLVSTDEINAYFKGWKMCNADGTSPYYKSEVPYTPSTWAEWSTACSRDSTGITMVADGTNWIQATLNCTFKISTKYGLLCNVITNTLSVDNLMSMASPFWYQSLVTKGVTGYVKSILTSSATATNFGMQVRSNETAGNTIKLKDFRIFELPAGSQIEADFTNLTADQLASKYTFNGLCTKYWKKLTDGSGLTSTLPTASYEGFTPYKFCYQLKNPTYSGPKWGSKALTADDITACTTLTSVQQITIAKPSTYLGYNSTAYRSVNYLDDYTEKTSALLDDAGDVNKYSSMNAAATFYLNVALGTYADLAAAKTGLTGKNLYYQLATPSTLLPVLDAYANGSAFVEYADGTPLPVTPKLTYKVDSGFNSYEQVKVSGDSKLLSHKVTKAGERAQVRFSFNLIRAFEDAYGTIPSTGTTVTDKVNWLKNNISAIGFYSYVYGSGPYGYKVYNNYLDAGVWSATISNNTASSPTLITRGPTPVANVIDSSGSFHGINYADPSDGTTASQVFIDYSKLDITFKNSNNTLELFTNQSVETSFYTSGKSPAYLVEVDLTPIANKLGGNAAMKSMAKSIVLEAWAQANGSYQGQVMNEVDIALYESAWGTTSGTNYNKHTSQAVSSTSFTKSSSAGNGIQDTNKVYFIIYSKHPSDATIKSQLSLDYLKAKITFTRLPDKPAPISIGL